MSTRPTTITLGAAKRDLKQGEVLTLVLQPDGFYASADIRIRQNLSFVDMTIFRKENANGNATSISACSCRR
jgi:hypothetical protein